MIERPSCWTLLVWQLLVGCIRLDQCALAVELRIEIVNQQGLPLVARMRVRDEAGKDHLPADASTVPIANDQWFVTSGESRLEVPSGKLNVRVERGPEFVPISRQIDCEIGKPTHLQVQLDRWIDMRALGYACGENHLHLPVDQLGPQLVAEGLDFGTSMQWWNARRFDVSHAQGPIRSLTYAGTSVPTSVFDYEIENDWGAVYVLGQRTPLVVDNLPDRPNLPTIRQSRTEGALVCYQGGWSREVLLDALLGQVDVVNICNNNFLRHAYQPRSRYSNLLGVTGLPTYPDSAEGMWQLNTDTYYRLLNCGLRLAAGAGSATGAKRTPVGYNRAYVRVDQGAQLTDFLESWRQGKNFVTNGPMLMLEVEGKHRPGDTITLGAQGKRLNISVSAKFNYPISRLEIVANGQVIRTLSDPSTTMKESFQFDVDESSWLAARCVASDRLLSQADMSAYTWGSAQMPRHPTRFRSAHTSPIYIELNGKSARVDKSIREARQMLDAIVTFASESKSTETQRQIADWVDEARGKLGQ